VRICVDSTIKKSISLQHLVVTDLNSEAVVRVRRFDDDPPLLHEVVVDTFLLPLHRFALSHHLLLFSDEVAHLLKSDHTIVDQRYLTSM